MANNILTNLDLNKNELQNVVIHKATSAPSNPKTGQIYYNTNDNNLYRYNGTSWVAYQNQITVNGILQGDGAGNISGLGSSATGVRGIDTVPTQSSPNLITSGGVYNALQSSSGGGAFFATYGTTTYAEVTAAYNEGKTIFVIREGLNGTTIYTLSDINSSNVYYFRSFSNQSATNYGAYLNSDDTWSANSYTYATLSSPIFTGIPKAPTAAVGTNTTQIATTAFVQSALESVVKMETGSYTGTGTYGSANPNTLTFSFAPKLVIVQSSGGSAYGPMFARDSATATAVNYHDTAQASTITWSNSGKTLSWYTQSNMVDFQLNRNNSEYIYIAIG